MANGDGLKQMEDTLEEYFSAMDWGRHYTKVTVSFPKHIKIKESKRAVIESIIDTAVQDIEDLLW